MPRISLPKLAHELVKVHLRRGDIAIDATVGNGHDTVFLAACVGAKGLVYGFDIQTQALEATRNALPDRQHVTLIHASHADMAAHIPSDVQGRVAVCMFNLGYLPGGDKRIITLAESTLRALNAACSLLASGGLLTVLAYPGHPDGDQETQRVGEWCGQLSPDKFDCRVFDSDADNPLAPRLWVINKY